MARYLALWEADNSRLPIDPKERGSHILEAINYLRQEMKKGLIKDWGSFVGTADGFIIYEGTEVEVNNSAVHFSPFYTFKVYPLSSLEQGEELGKALSK
jgi:hypothetical protein